MKPEIRFASTITAYVILVSFLLVYLFASNPDVKSVFVSILFLTWAFITTNNFFYMHEESSTKPASEQEVADWINNNPEKCALFQLQYEELRAGIQGRDNMTIVAGSIMVSASLILLGILVQIQSNTYIDFGIEALMTATIMSIYSIWFVGFNLTSKKLDDMQYNRLVEMEEAKDFKLVRFMRENLEGKNWSKYVRRPVWLYFFYVLTTACIIILLV